MGTSLLPGEYYLFIHTSCFIIIFCECTFCLESLTSLYLMSGVCSDTFREPSDLHRCVLEHYPVVSLLSFVCNTRQPHLMSHAQPCSQLMDTSVHLPTASTSYYQHAPAHAYSLLQLMCTCGMSGTAYIILLVLPDKQWRLYWNVLMLKVSGQLLQF